MNTSPSPDYLDHYDFIFTGGGAAALSLACHMLNTSLRERTMLIIDMDSKQKNDRTWCFWTTRPTLFEPIVHRTWERLFFAGAGGFKHIYTLAPYRYQMIRGIDFYQHTRRLLSACDNIHFLQASVEQVEDGDNSGLPARVTAGGRSFSAGYVFNSIVRRGFKPDPQRYHSLLQHFRGWEISTTSPAFDPSLPTLFDFRTPQKDALTFMYILPYDPTHAMVEYTLFSPAVLSDGEYDQALDDYIRNILKIPAYTVEFVENGVIPMTDYPFQRRSGNRVLQIGTSGGRVKPSSGYAFLRIQRDSAAIVQSLLTHGHPFHPAPDSPIFHYLDSIMLQVMFRHGNDMINIFTAMFKNNPIQRVFRFLDETTTPAQLLGVLLSVPPWRFIKSWFKLKILRKI